MTGGTDDGKGPANQVMDSYLLRALAVAGYAPSFFPLRPLRRRSGGISSAPYTDHMENAGWYLAQVPGIDVVLLGHSHDIFQIRTIRNRTTRTCPMSTTRAVRFTARPR